MIHRLRDGGSSIDRVSLSNPAGGFGFGSAVSVLPAYACRAIRVHAHRAEPGIGAILERERSRQAVAARAEKRSRRFDSERVER